MPRITLPPPQDHPERYTALRQLLELGERPQRVVRVFAAGDPEAQLSDAGAKRETILFVNAAGRPRTALLTPIGELIVRNGWPDVGLAA